MWKSLFNNNLRRGLLVGSLLILGQAASAAGPIVDIDINRHANSVGPFVAGVATNTSISQQEMIIFTYSAESGGTGVPSAGQVVRLELLDHNGNVIENGISPASFTTDGDNQFQGGEPTLPLTFFRAGTNLKLKASIGNVEQTSTDFNVSTGAPARLLIIGPGMTHYPGTDPSLSDGSTGSFTPQEPNQPFNVRVFLTDNQFNAISRADTVTFISDPTLIILPSPNPGTLNLGIDGTEFEITITGARTDRTIIVSDSDGTIADGSLAATTAGPPAKEVLPFPSPFNPLQGDIQFRVRLTNPEEITVKVIDLFGQQIWEKSVGGSAGFNYVAWNGRNDKGTVVAAGAYYVLLEVGGSLEDKKRFGVTK